MLLVALAAWQPPGRTRDRVLEGRTAPMLPSLFIAVGIAVLTYDHFDADRRLAAQGGESV